MYLISRGLSYATSLHWPIRPRLVHVGAHQGSQIAAVAIVVALLLLLLMLLLLVNGLTSKVLILTLRVVWCLALSLTFLCAAQRRGQQVGVLLRRRCLLLFRLRYE